MRIRMQTDGDKGMLYICIYFFLDRFSLGQVMKGFFLIAVVVYRAKK